MMQGTNEKVIAAFDFDGTITKGDSLFYFLLFRLKVGKLLRVAIPSSYYFLLYKLKLMPNYTAKEKLFSLFFRGMSIEEFNNRCVQFREELTKMVRPNALAKLHWHVSQGHEVIIISASIENWIAPWSNTIGVTEILATQIAVQDGFITGEFLSRNCYGSEKVNRLLAFRPERSEYKLYAYGDSNGDKELLGIADYPYYRAF
ncbi:HAD family hydrolase [Parapedobacter sp. DT-150]|uniref:HAD family hydrolase n=1 Tax=Parapedobacter sp. DT-150 TaxID=3396162 RepID=UPI003F1D1BD4